MLPDYKSAFFFFLLITKLAFCLLFYICHLGPCFGPGHCCPFGDPTLVDFICCWIPKWVTGVCLRNRVPSPGSWSLGHVPFVVLICFLATCHTDMYLHLFVLMIGQLLYKNSNCMAIKIFWLDLTWLDHQWLVVYPHNWLIMRRTFLFHDTMMMHRTHIICQVVFVFIPPNVHALWYDFLQCDHRSYRIYVDHFVLITTSLPLYNRIDGLVQKRRKSIAVHYVCH